MNARPLIAGGLVLILGGCASVDPEPDYLRAQEEVALATGAEELFQPGEEEDAAERVAQLFEDGLTSEEAVQVALLNHPELQALLFEIGVRRADAVQAGLLSNPSLEALLRFPIGDGSTTFEGGLGMNLIEFWHLPVREQAAEAEVERTILAVAHRAAAVAAQAKTAYFLALAADSSWQVAAENLATASEFLDLTRERKSEGEATQVDLNAARSSYLEQQVLVRSAEFEALDAKRELALALGLATPPGEVLLAETLAAPADHSMDLERLFASAREYRLDLRSAEMAVEATGQLVPLERRRKWQWVGGGLAFESEGGEWSLGPALELELPIFDQNQAQIAIAEYRHAQALSRLDGLASRMAQQIRGAHQRYSVAQDTVRLYRTELLPLRESSLELAREAFAAGKTGFLSVLEAQDRLLETRREYVDWLAAYSVSIPGLEAACGRPLDALLESGGPENVELHE